jgi:chromosomal replication initiator protein
MTPHDTFAFASGSPGGRSEPLGPPRLATQDVLSALDPAPAHNGGSSARGSDEEHPFVAPTEVRDVRGDLPRSGGTSVDGAPAAPRAPSAADTRPAPIAEGAILGELSASIAAALARRLQPEQYATWFRRVRLVKLDERAAVFAVPNEFAREWIANYYLDPMAAAVQASLGVKRRVELRVDPEAAVEHSPFERGLEPEQRAARESEDPGEHDGRGRAESRIGDGRGGRPGGESDAGQRGGFPGFAREREDRPSPPRPSRPSSPASAQPSAAPPHDRDRSSGRTPSHDRAAGNGSSHHSTLDPRAPLAPMGGQASGRNGGPTGPGTDSRTDSRNGAMPAGRDTLLHSHSDIVLNQRYTFEHYVVGPCNRFAHAAAMGAAEHPGRAYNPLFLHGRVGVGKTHLLQALCFMILERQPASRILYLSCETFVNHFINALENGT